MCVNLLRVIILAIVVGELCAARAHADDLREGFQSPPSSARPRTWWHWMNGNVTKDGIAKDLAWMKEVGLGGLQNFDVNLATPQIVAKRLVYMTPGWKAAFRFAVGLAQEKGLEFAIASSPGWSETGGPWVPSQDGAVTPGGHAPAGSRKPAAGSVGVGGGRSRLGKSPKR